MTFQIRHDGKTYTVHTEVGNGLTQVVFDDEDSKDAARAGTTEHGAQGDLQQGARHE